MEGQGPQPKRARIAPTEQLANQNNDAPHGTGSASVTAPSFVTGATTPAIALHSTAPAKLSSPVVPGSAPEISQDNTALTASCAVQAAGSGPTAAPPAHAAGAPPKPSAAPGPAHAQPATKKQSGTATGAGSAFLANAHEAVTFRAVACRDGAALEAEIQSGGRQFSVEFMHQHFGDDETIRGYSGLRITIWVHVQTYHAWVDIRYASKRPGADKLSAIFDGAFPCGYCRSKEDFLDAVAATSAVLPDLMASGETVGTLRLPVGPGGAPAFGAKAAGSLAGGAAAGAAGGACVDKEADAGLVKVQRWLLVDAPEEVKALHQRLEPLLLFTIDGANFIDDEDRQWELLLPVARAADGGCLVLGLTTLFNFFSYPASCRLRVSQVLVLPPWQGGGLGKGLLRVGYQVAEARGCADLTVEDPTPNLQRVREKLEVEMMQGVDWVAGQARKCIEAAARGERSWPPAAVPPHLLAPPSKPQLQPQHQPLADGGSDVPMAEAVGDGAEGQQQQQDSQGGQKEGRGQPGAAGQGQPHSLLQAHAFFRALAAPPPAGREIPPATLAEAADGEARKRGRMAAAELVRREERQRRREQQQAEAGTEAGGSGSGAPAAAAAPPAPVCGALVPPASFITAVSRCTRIHAGQVRVVWEALLWATASSLPGGLAARPAVRSALAALVERRLEAQHFSSVGRAAAAKVLLDLAPSSRKKNKDGNGKDSASAAATAADATDGLQDKDQQEEAGKGPKEDASANGGTGSNGAGKQEEEESEGNDDEGNPANFIMYRPLARQQQGQGQGGATAERGAIATGRLNLTTVSAEDKAVRMAELAAERSQQLAELARLLGRRAA